MIFISFVFIHQKTALAKSIFCQSCFSILVRLSSVACGETRNGTKLFERKCMPQRKIYSNTNFVELFFGVLKIVYFNKISLKKGYST